MSTIQTPMDGRIGTLIRGGKTIFYAFVKGYDHPPVEGSRKKVEQALGLHHSGNARPLQNYLVTVTPSMVVYAGTAELGAYSVEVFAKTRREAIRKARDERLENEGRCAVPATYQARLLAP